MGDTGCVSDVIAAATGAVSTGEMVTPVCPTAEESAQLDALEIQNEGGFEAQGIVAAIQAMELHMDELCAQDSALNFVLCETAAKDNELHQLFRAHFSPIALDVALLTFDDLKSEAAMARWRPLLASMERRVDEYNKMTILRLDAAQGYGLDGANTICVPRAQFLLIEIARNLEGINDSEQLRAVRKTEELVGAMHVLRKAISEQNTTQLLSTLSSLQHTHPLLNAEQLRQSKIGRVLHKLNGPCSFLADDALDGLSLQEVSERESLQNLSRQLEEQWKAGLALTSQFARADTDPSVSQAVGFVLKHWGALSGQKGVDVTRGGSSSKMLCQCPLEQHELQVELSSDERNTSKLSDDALQMASYKFNKYGICYIQSAVSPALLEHTTRAVDSAFDVLNVRLSQLDPPLNIHKDNFSFGEVQYRDGSRLDNRFLIRSTICGSEQVAQHPLWWPVVQRLLGPKAKLLFAGVVEAYPSANPRPQEWHRDGQALPSPNGNPQTSLPPHCINLFIPLIDIDTPEIGPTEFWVGTQKQEEYIALQQQQSTRRTPVPPEGKPNGTVSILAPAGSAILFDYRLIHRGCPNFSNKCRRVLYLTYSADWFSDAVNFEAPSILGAQLPPSPAALCTHGASSLLWWVLGARSNGSVQIPTEWCDVGHRMHTSAFGALLARAALALLDGRRLIQPLRSTSNQEDTNTAEVADAADAPTNETSSIAAAFMSKGGQEQDLEVLWAALLRQEGSTGGGTGVALPADLELLQNIAAAMRFQTVESDSQSAAVDDFVSALRSEESEAAGIQLLELDTRNAVQVKQMAAQAEANSGWAKELLIAADYEEDAPKLVECWGEPVDDTAEEPPQQVGVGYRVGIHYRGCFPHKHAKLQPGDEFVSSYTSGKLLTFVTGRNEVIRGLDEGVQTMAVGEHARFHISAKAGYGAAGDKKVPPNTDVIYDVHVVGAESTHSSDDALDRFAKNQLAEKAAFSAEGHREADTPVGHLFLGSKAVIQYPQDGQSYDAEVVKITDSAVVWCYVPSLDFWEWYETISNEEMATGVYAGMIRVVDSDAELGTWHLKYAEALKQKAAEQEEAKKAAKSATVEKADFADRMEDVLADDRLMELALAMSGNVLESRGFSNSRFGLEVFLASAKAAVPAKLAAKLEEGVTGWWHGGISRFELDVVEPSKLRMAGVLVVAFSSLGNGLIRPEFRGTIKKAAPDCDALYVLDPACSWYCQDPSCQWEGQSYYEAELKRYIEQGQYKQVIMIGDSMGGSGALLFAHLATRVLAFVPQVDLHSFPQVTRHDFTPKARQLFSDQVTSNCEAAQSKGTTITIHIGVDEEDERQVAALESLQDANVATGVHVVRHEEFKGHHVSALLKEAGRLAPLLATELAALNGHL